MFAFGKRRPRFDLNVIFLEENLCVDLLIKWVRLDLIDGRNDFVVNNYVHDAIRIEIANADSFDFTGSI